MVDYRHPTTNIMHIVRRRIIMNVVELKRVNKVTTYWEGEGVAIGNFYRTNDKLGTVKSTDVAVITGGFKMPEGRPASEGVAAIDVTPQEKLEAFKTFLEANAAVFGFTYDPVDRRPDQFKFPSKYDEATCAQFSLQILNNTLTEVATSVQNNIIDKMVKDGVVPAGSALAFSIGEAATLISEKYGSGSIKYATVTYPVTLVVGDNQVAINVEVGIVSGQLKKPRNFGTYPFTMTGIKNALIDNSVLPKIEQKPKEDKAAEVPAGTEAPVDAAPIQDQSACVENGVAEATQQG